MDAKHRVLKQVFGYDQFRQGQEAVIDAILQGRDALGVMPTGAGKSICYQVPGLVFSGITLVVSPLISLMRDQVAEPAPSRCGRRFSQHLPYPCPVFQSVGKCHAGSIQDHLCGAGTAAHRPLSGICLHRTHRLAGGG